MARSPLSGTARSPLSPPALTPPALTPLASSPAAPAAPAASAAARSPQVLAGTPGEDTLTGTDRADRIDAGAGRDTLFGQGGHDHLRGGAGSDSLFGGDGNDRLMAGADDDALYAGAGNDRLFGEGGHDGLNGDDGHDHLEGGAGHDRLTGGAGRDILIGGAGDDTLFASVPVNADTPRTSPDVLDRSANRLEGGAGRDDLFGGMGNDTLTGGPDKDYLAGGEGADTYRFATGDGPQGGPGEEIIEEVTNDHSGRDRDTLALTDVRFGAAGLYVDGLGGNLRVFYGAGDLVTVPGQFRDPTAAVEQLSLAGAGTFRIDTARGTAGQDLLISAIDNAQDRLVAGAGRDILVGGFGSDALIGGEGNDLYLFRTNHGTDSIRDTGGWDVVVLDELGDLDQVRLTRRGDDLLIRHDADGSRIRIHDQFRGHAVEAIQAGDGSRLLLPQQASARGSARDDLLLGDDAGEDRIHGRAGDDTLVGGGWADDLRGGAGNDTYRIGFFGGPDQIRDTAGGADRVILEDTGVSEPLYLETTAEGDLTLQYRNNSWGVDQVTIIGQDDPRTAVESLVLNGPGDSLVSYDLTATRGTGHNDVLVGRGRDEVMRGGAGDDILVGRGGDDILEGGRGGDLYAFRTGDGQDRISERDGAVAADQIDRIVLFDVYDTDGLRHWQSGQDLVIEYGDDDRIVVEDHFRPGNQERQVEYLILGNGAVADLTRNIYDFQFMS